MKVTQVISPLTVLLLLSMAASARNLLSNGDFENGNSGFATDYLFGRTDTAEGYYHVVRNPRDSHWGGGSFSDHTSGSGYMFVANGSLDTNRVLWSQTVNVQPQTAYEFAAWTTSWGNAGEGTDPNPSTLRVAINGKIVGPAFHVGRKNGVWQQLSVSWNSQTSSVAVIQLRLETAALFGNDVALDDLSFQPSSTRVTVEVGEIRVCWPSAPGTKYQLEYRSEVTGNLWAAAGGSVTADDFTTCVHDPIEGKAPRFYRVREIR